MKKLLLILSLIPLITFGQSLPSFALDQEKFLTDKKGALLLKNSLDLKVGDVVVINTQDGFEVKGKVFKREEEKGKFIKIYGNLNDDENSGFGLMFSLEGGINGAVVLKKTDTNYVLTQNSVDNSFYFVRSFKFEKNVIL